MIAPATYPKIEHPSERMGKGLAAEVEGALWAYNPLRTSIVDLTVTADGGHVTLSGIVRGPALRFMAQRLAEDVAGVTAVDNELLTDTDIESQVAQALAADEVAPMLTDRFRVKSIMGTLFLGGTVAAPELARAETARSRATEIGRGVPGVRDVVNQLVAVQEAGAVGAGTPSGATIGGGPAASQDGISVAMKERLQVWRERAGSA